MTDQRETTDQLDLFRQPPPGPIPVQQSRSEPPVGRRQLEDAEIKAAKRHTQMTELAGETWEDAFGDAA